MNADGRGVAENVGAQLIFGTAGWLVMASGVPVPQMIFWRCLLGAAVLGAVCWAMGLLRRSSITREQLLRAALGGAVLIAAWLLLFGSLAYASISVSTAVYHTQPFMLLGLGALLLRQPVTSAKLVWLAVAFVGMVLIVQGKPVRGSYGANYALGIAMALGAAACYAVVTLLTIQLKAVKPHLIALVQMAVGVLLLGPLAAIAPLPQGLQAWGCIAAFGIVCTGVAYILLYSSYQKLPTHVIGALAFIYPAAAVAVDFVMLGHRLQPLQLLGVAVVLGAAAGTTLGARRGRQPAAAPS